MNKKSVIGSVLMRMETQWLKLGKRFPDDVDAAIEALRKDTLKFCDKKNVRFVHTHRLSVVFDSSIFQGKMEDEATRTKEEFVRVLMSAFAAAVFRGSPLRMALDLIEAMTTEMFAVVEEKSLMVPVRGSGLTVIK